MRYAARTRANRVASYRCDPNVSDGDLERLKIDRTAQRPRGRGLVRRAALWMVLLVAAVAAGWAVLGRERTEPVETAPVVNAYPSQAYTMLNATGYVVAQRKAAVASKATGRLEWLGVQEGSRVKRGEIVARLESRDVVAQMEQARANVTLARANLEQVRAEFTDAQAAFSRSRDLLARNFVSPAAHDTVVARLAKARAAIAGQEAAIAVAEAGLRGAEVAVEQTLIRAPFDGVVLTKSANVGDVITPFSSALDSKGAVVTMADMTTLEVEADVSESNLSKVAAGQPCEIQLDALPDLRFRGTVSRMVPTVDRSKATIVTKIRFEALDERVLPEMSAKVAFLSQPVADGERKPRAAAPAAAVVKRDGRDVVFVVEGGKVALRGVELGARIGDLVEVTGGARVGERVVLKPGETLRDGSLVATATK